MKKTICLEKYNLADVFQHSISEIFQQYCCKRQRWNSRVF